MYRARQHGGEGDARKVVSLRHHLGADQHLRRAATKALELQPSDREALRVRYEALRALGPPSPVAWQRYRYWVRRRAARRQYGYRYCATFSVAEGGGGYAPHPGGSHPGVVGGPSRRLAASLKCYKRI